MEKKLYGLVALNTTRENLARYSENTANEVIASLLDAFEQKNLDKNFSDFLSTLNKDQYETLHALLRMFIMRAAHYTSNNILKMINTFSLN